MEISVLSLLSHSSHIKSIIEGITVLREVIPKSHIVSETVSVIDHDSLKRQSDVLHALVEDMNNNPKMLNSSAVKICLQQLADTVDLIQKNFKEIDEIITNHNSKWFSYLRSYNIETQKNKLAHLAPQLDEQMDRLIKILSITAS